MGLTERRYYMEIPNRSGDFPLPEHDVSFVLRKIVQLELRREPPFMRFGPEFWEEVRTKLPNMYDFISSTAYQIGGENPILREEVAAGLGGLLVLLAEAQQSQDLEGQWRYLLEEGEWPATGDVLHAGDVTEQPEA